jgi:hypothetical protein
VSIHEHSGQKRVIIVAYVRSVVYSESELIMKRWRTKDEDSKPVIETRSERCNDAAPFVAEDIQIRSVKEVTVVRHAALGISRRFKRF